MYLRGGAYTDLQDYHRSESEGAWLAWDANDLIALASTWESGDISKTSRVGVLEQGNLEAALAGIKAKALILPSKDDMFFTVRACFQQRAALSLMVHFTIPGRTQCEGGGSHEERQREIRGDTFQLGTCRFVDRVTSCSFLRC